MRRPRTDFTGWSAEEIRIHKNKMERVRRAHDPEKDRARGRRYYKTHKDEVIARQKAASHAQPERRRTIVRRSKHKNPMRVLVESASRRAAKKGALFTLTADWGRERYIGRCELSGLEFTSHGRLTGKVSPFAPSLDQINPGEGYTPENTQIVLWALNRFKGDMPLATMMVIACALVEKQKSI